MAGLFSSVSSAKETRYGSQAAEQSQSHVLDPTDGRSRSDTRPFASDASTAPEEDSSSRIDQTRRAAREHLAARRQILALRAERGSGSSTRDEGGTWLLQRQREKPGLFKSFFERHHKGEDRHAAVHDDDVYHAEAERQAHARNILERRDSLDDQHMGQGGVPEDVLDEANVHDLEQDEGEEESALSAAFLVSYFVAGGAAGAASRTVVSPLERLKIIMQVQPKSASTSGKGAYSGVISGLRKMWHEEGFKGYMRGNGINCLRIAPYSAVQFSTYEILKTYLTGEDGELDVPRRLTAGALAGIASVVSTYPLDLVRSRISIASASMYAEAKSTVAQASGSLSEPGTSAQRKRKPTRDEVRRIIEERQKRIPGIVGMTAKVYREEGGIRALYKGCVPTSLGVAPYVGINFAAYEALRNRLINEDGEISTWLKLCCGALAGSISQTLTYPLDVLRRRMQVSGMKDSKLGYSDKSAWGAIRTIVTAEGFFGLYRGIVPNLLKVAPSIGTSFAVYEFVQNRIHPPHHHHHHHHNNNNAQCHNQAKVGASNHH